MEELRADDYARLTTALGIDHQVDAVGVPIEGDRAAALGERSRIPHREKAAAVKSAFRIEGVGEHVFAHVEEVTGIDLFQRLVSLQDDLP